MTGAVSFGYQYMLDCCTYRALLLLLVNCTHACIVWQEVHGCLACQALCQLCTQLRYV